MTTLKYTAERSGVEEIHLPGFGLITKGDTIEIEDKATAKAMAAPAEDDLSDWEIVTDKKASASAASKEDD